MRRGWRIDCKKPLVSDYKGLLTASYQNPVVKKWQFEFDQPDLMEVAVCRHRMHLIRYWEPNFKAYTVVNAQITKYFRQWSIYVGAENLFNYKQPNPIIDASNPRWG